MSDPRSYRVRLGVAVLFLVLTPSLARSQGARAPVATRDSVEMVAGARYEAGGLHRLLFGAGYRDLWTTPLQVEVLDLRSFAGGLRPLRLAGGLQTKSLRFVAPDGVEYVFRSVDKSGTQTPRRFRGTVVEAVFRDQISTSDPAAALVAARLLDAANVLHVTPLLMVMPDDPALGEFRADFAGRLGMIEESPGTPGHDAGFAGAIAIIDSDTLRYLLDHDPEERIDAPAMLTARLMDMLLGDYDRHQGQWRWARMRADPRSAWLPIPRDRDKAFISYGGVVIGLARPSFPNLAAFRGSYSSVRGLTWNSLEFDRRLLGGLERPVWDSVTAELVGRITDSVIDGAVLALPAEYLASAPELARKLKMRRDALPGAADRFYRLIAAVADIHATDAADRATVTRVDDRTVEVRLESGNGTPYFLRRFDARETTEIRIYLHGGNDTAAVTGDVATSIRVRIIGGNGDNQVIDSSEVGASHGRARLYDVGTVAGVGYGPDTLFNREPWVMQGGRLVPPGRDRGAQSGPIIGLRHDRDLGFLPRFGFYRAHYGFGRRPYASRVGLEAEYSMAFGRSRVTMTADRRLEGTPVHLIATARMSQLEVVSYHGLGNATPDTTTTFYEAGQRQWMVRPALAVALGPRSDLSLGPVIQFSVTDTTLNTFLATAQPYGFGRFGQAGLRIVLHHDARDAPRDPHRGLLVDLTGSFFPAVWDVKSAFGEITGGASAFLRLRVPAHPILAMSGGAKKVFGTFPFHEAAFLGGRTTLRSLDMQRYAGDAAVYGSVELRVPVARFSFVLPLNVGVFGVLDAGRVYVNGASPGGWHTAKGLGFWIGVLDPTSAVRVCRRWAQKGPC